MTFLENRKGSANSNILDFTFPQNHANRNFKQKMVRSLESNDDSEAEKLEYMRMQKLKNSSGGSHYPQNTRVTNISDFQSIEHNPQYSSSSRGYGQMEKSNYSLSPNHTKAPSNNSGYFMLNNNSSRNARRPGKLEHMRTDPSGFQLENKNSMQKYSNRMMQNLNQQDNKSTYETGPHPSKNIRASKQNIYQRSYDNPMLHHPQKITESQRMMHSSDADEMRMHTQNFQYDSVNLNLNENTKKFKSNDGSSGGTSVESSNHFRNQFYPRAAKLNISDMTEQIPGQNNDDPESMFYKVQRNNQLPVDRKRIANRNSRDHIINSVGSKTSDEEINYPQNLAFNKGKRQVVSRNISNKGSGSVHDNSYQMSTNKRNNSNNSMFNSNDNLAEGKQRKKMFEEHRMSTQVNAGYRSENLDGNINHLMHELTEIIDELNNLICNAFIQSTLHSDHSLFNISEMSVLYLSEKNMERYLNIEAEYNDKSNKAFNSMSYHKHVYSLLPKILNLL